MKKVNFDDFADDYDSTLGKSLNFFEPDTDYFAHYKVSLVKKALNRKPDGVLDFGCGIGSNIRHLITEFPDASVTGCDVSEKSLVIAAQNNPAARFFLLGDSVEPPAGKFDLVFIANVFHHVPPGQRADTLLFIKSLMTEAGDLFIFEHNPFNPVTRHLVNTCPFDADAQLLRPKQLSNLLQQAGLSVINKNYVLFFPSLFARLRPVERYLTALPLGGQYLIRASA
jgi:SAM-dependent methyltransferase